MSSLLLYPPHTGAAGGKEQKNKNDGERGRGTQAVRWITRTRYTRKAERIMVDTVMVGTVRWVTQTKIHGKIERRVRVEQRHRKMKKKSEGRTHSSVDKNGPTKSKS